MLNHHDPNITVIICNYPHEVEDETYLHYCLVDISRFVMTFKELKTITVTFQCDYTDVACTTGFPRKCVLATK